MKGKGKTHNGTGHTCGECWYMIPDAGNLSVVTGEPVMGSCKHCKYMRLLSEDACENFKTKEI